MPALVLINISLYTKLELPTFTRSKDMMGAQNSKSVSWPWPHPFQGSIGSEVPISTRYEDTKSDAKYRTSASVKDWCMPPRGIAGPRHQSSPNSGHKCRLARPLTLVNFVALRQKCARYPLSAVENFCSGKSGPIKVHQNRLRPVIVMPNLIALSQSKGHQEKRYKFYTLQYWRPRGGSGPKLTSFWSDVQQGPVCQCQISSCTDS